MNVVTSNPFPSLRHRFLALHCRWLILIGEHLHDPQGETLEYWRIEKADSVIILPIHRQQLLLPPPTYRLGIGAETWDFPGGRIPAQQTPEAMVPLILQRELGVQPNSVRHLTPLSQTGWAVNSAFSNQSLYGVVAELDDAIEVNPKYWGQAVPITSQGIQTLLDSLICLQCRAVLLQWWWTMAATMAADGLRQK